MRKQGQLKNKQIRNIVNSGSTSDLSELLSSPSQLHLPLRSYSRISTWTEKKGLSPFLSKYEGRDVTADPNEIMMLTESVTQIHISFYFWFQFEIHRGFTRPPPLHSQIHSFSFLLSPGICFVICVLFFLISLFTCVLFSTIGALVVITV